MTIETTVMEPTTDEAAARSIASEYIHAKLGIVYGLEQGFFCDGSARPVWRFLVLNQEHDAVAGYIDVDLETGQVIPLTSEQFQDLRERAVVTAAKNRKTVARNQDGYILPFLAKVRVNGYLSNSVAFFASAKGQPVFVDGNPPVWRVNTVLQLLEQGKVVDLGIVDVDARTGDIIPLAEQQIQNLQRCTEDVAASLQRSATTAG